MRRGVSWATVSRWEPVYGLSLMVHADLEYLPGTGCEAIMTVGRYTAAAVLLSRG